MIFILNLNLEIEYEDSVLLLFDSNGGIKRCSEHRKRLSLLGEKLKNLMKIADIYRTVLILT